MEVDTIIPLHILTGSDHASGYYGIGKGPVANRVSKSAEAKNMLASCGSSLELTPDIKRNMTLFTIRYIYNDKTSSSVSEANL